MKARLAAALAIAVALAAAIIVDARSRHATARRDADVERLHAVVDAEAALVEAVLEARAGVVLHYDDIVRAAAAARDAERLASELRAWRGADDASAASLDRVAAAGRSREAPLETFKTDLALARSSARGFPVVVGALVARGPALASRLEPLRADVALYQGTPTRDLGDRIESEVSALESAASALDAATRAELAVVFGHARAIVERSERADRITRALASAPTRADAVAALAAYEREAERAAFVSIGASAAAAALAVALLALVVALVRELRARRASA